MNLTSRPPRFWRLLLALGVALAVAFLVDGKFLLLLLALAWIVTMSFALWRIRRNQRV